MNAGSAVSPRVVRLPSDDALDAWRTEARALLCEGVRPEDVLWQLGGESDLFAGADGGRTAAPREGVRLPRKAVDLVKTAIHHSDRGRFSLLYRFLWRCSQDRSLAENLADPDTAAVHRLEKSVRRDAHKMHAFVRFRKVDERSGRERFAAWFEPDHHIVEREAPFFVRRFANMDWAIVTPRKTVIYENGEVRFAPGGKRSDVPAEDAVEGAWQTYYASIFNPARIMTDAMRAEMPKKYWKNLPEAALIPSLLEGAPQRVEAMRLAAERAEPALRLPAEPHPELTDLDAIREAIGACRACPHACTATQAVPGEGPRGAALFLVGEQPGDAEDVAGRPFIGPAGQLLDSHLSAAGIDRSSVYVTNAVKHFKFLARGKRRIHQTPKPGDIDACAPYLRAEHSVVAPRVTVTLGATALRGLLQCPVPLGKVRGDVLRLDEPGRRVLIPTVHPAFLLRITDPGQRRIEERKFAADLAKARSLADSF